MKQKILFFIIVVIISLLTFHNFYYKKHLKDITHQVNLQKANDVKKFFQREVELQHGRTAALTYLISKDQVLIDALIKKDRTLLDHKKTIQMIEHYGGYKDLWIQVIDKDGFSFYRSWTNKVGDSIKNARLDLAQMLIDQKPKQTVSTGRFDMTFKTILPLFDNGEFIGIVEVISKFNQIAEHLKEKSIEPLMVLKEDYTYRFIKPYTGLFISNNYVANKNASKELMKKVEQEGLDKFLFIKDYINFEEYIVTTDQIKDVKGNDMGYFILFIKKSDIDNSAVSEFQASYFNYLSITLIIFILLSLFFINRVYLKMLSKDVANKTKQIQEQQNKLESLLDTYDKNVIFSRTDLKGIITDVSSAFCKISGYTKDELIGMNHNLVRNSDMPKETFKDMWDTIKQEKTWYGEVKNKNKNGSSYWVHAEVEPYYSSSGKHIGYSAVREDITDSKEIEEIQKEIIFTLGSIGESRSLETGNHVKRVAEYSYLLAIHYGLDEKTAQMIKQATPMHDIGKIAIPDAILKKPAKLTQDEFNIMKTHAIQGYEMLKSSNRPLLKTAATIALTHHERYDGKGYPYQEIGKNIHIYGRIVAVADVFDALGSDRCYKEAWEDDRIFELFKDEKGKQFDPDLIDIFFENLDEFLKIRDSIRDI
ncbi:MAG: PAS domain S-box protein [Campylobacterota bacterium]|nr:PAS domain S-box protein [Campylobacterota bacterium]